MTGAERPGLLLATRLSVLAAEVADPDRFRRGRVYAREGAVLDVEVEAGLVTGTVLGSRREPYRIELRARPSGGRGSVVPAAADLDAWCNCPDAALVCKHAVAVLLAFSERVGRQPELLSRWWPEPVGSPEPEPIPVEDAAPVGLSGHALVEFFGGPRRWTFDPSRLPPLAESPGSVGQGELERVALKAIELAVSALVTIYG